MEVASCSTKRMCRFGVIPRLDLLLPPSFHLYLNTLFLTGCFHLVDRLYLALLFKRYQVPATMGKGPKYKAPKVCAPVHFDAAMVEFLSKETQKTRNGTYPH